MAPAMGCKSGISTPDPTIANRLAGQLSALLPGVAAVDVRLQDPRTPWPHLRFTAVDEEQRAVHVPRAKALTIARWLIRSFPQAGWAAQPMRFDLRTAVLSGRDAR
ncbi:transcriptional regulator [Streptomyces niveiscabiei]|uniref:transcriptional regulator n=1 Tax=Streptomyces niveiscabiei TaxID=164115 RepID=UPI001F0A336C|nr:transcriptional regulator [Streptomyces niveiscabiei]